MPIKNLGKQKIIKTGYETRARSLIAEAQGAYQLTISLLVASVLGNEELYREVRNKLFPLLEKALANSETAWLYGRLLLAADNVDDKKTAELTERAMMTILESKDIKADEYTAWAWGYLAIYNAVNWQKYPQLKNDMVAAADKVDKTNLSNVLWAYVMDIQAAAVANDRLTYHAILEKMKTVTNQTTIVDALKQIPADDFRTWAMASVALAAATMADNDTYKLLNNVVKALLNEPVKETYGDKSNRLLAEVNLQLARVRCEQLTEQHQYSIVFTE